MWLSQAYLRSLFGPDMPVRWANVEMLLSYADSLDASMDHKGDRLDALTQACFDPRASQQGLKATSQVILSTAVAGAGLRCPVVCITGVEAGVYPSHALQTKGEVLQALEQLQGALHCGTSEAHLFYREACDGSSEGGVSPFIPPHQLQRMREAVEHTPVSELTNPATSDRATSSGTSGDTVGQNRPASNARAATPKASLSREALIRESQNASFRKPTQNRKTGDTPNTPKASQNAVSTPGRAAGNTANRRSKSSQKVNEMQQAISAGRVEEARSMMQHHRKETSRPKR